MRGQETWREIFLEKFRNKQVHFSVLVFIKKTLKIILKRAKALQWYIMTEIEIKKQ